jgi:hypothetical protein
MVSKFFATASLLFTSQMAAAAGQDFFQGVQTGVFLASEEEFNDYQCPLPEVSD